MANQTTKDGWLSSIETLLESVDYGYIQSCSISIVPEGLKKSNDDAYLPRVVCIGPRFKGSREDLLLMEEVKLRCMLSLIHRGKEKGAPAYLKECSDAVWELDEQVRANYAAEINLEKHELAKTMLVDGCFLLELLISKGMDAKLPSGLIPPGPAPEVLKDDDVLSDLMLFENQIPIFILHKLSQILFPDLFEPDREELREEKEEQREERVKRINNLSLSVLGYSQTQVQSLKATHILDIVHFFVSRKAEREKEISEDFNHVVVDIMERPSYVKLELKRCALRLITGGITIKLPEDTDSGGLFCFSLLWNFFSARPTRRGDFFDTTKHRDLDMPTVDLRGLDFDFKFKKGKLEIAQLHITKTTKARWCNVIAWEHFKKNRVDRASYDIPAFEFGSDGEARCITSLNGKFTSAALIFNGLICCADDVQLLKDKNIIVDHLKMSNEELLAFFHTIPFGVDHGVVDSSFIEMIDGLNNYSPLTWNKVSISFIYWLLRFMNRNYNFVATVLAVLSIVQTVYAVLAYYLPK